MLLDSYYTPRHLSERLISLYANGRPRRIADFCAGEGCLLKACELRFPQSHYIAIDKAKGAITKLRKAKATWSIHQADFLDDNQIDEIGLKEHSIDLIMMNPPFTCRGTLFKCELDGIPFSVSKAMLFLSRAIKYLAKEGVVLAILPVGVMNAERDARIVRYLKQVYDFHVCEKVSKVSFRGKEPNVVLVSLRSPKKIPKFRETLDNVTVPVCLHRGSCNVVTANSEASLKGVRFVHTTNMQNGRLVDLRVRIPTFNHRVLNAFAVLVPRVGTPHENKLVVVDAGNRYVLSDCVIAIMCRGRHEAEMLRELLLSNRQRLFRLYAGTGARYVTLKKIAGFLARYVPADLLVST